MIVSSSRRIVLIIVAAISSGCSPVNVYMLPGDEPEKTFTTIVQESLTELTGIPAYSSHIKYTDSFIITALPGIPITESDLEFTALSGTNLVGDTHAVDQAYRFAKLVNQIVLSTSSYEETGMQLGNLYKCLLGQVPSDEISGYRFNDLTLIEMNSSTYNDGFYLTTITPAVSDIQRSWTEYERIFNRQGVVLNEGEVSSLISGYNPSHRFKAAMVRLNLSRHGMLDKLIEDSRQSSNASIVKCLSRRERPLAMITGLIVVKKLDVVKYPASNGRVIVANDTSSTSIKPAESAVSMRVEGPLIIGIIATLL